MASALEQFVNNVRTLSKQGMAEPYIRSKSLQLNLEMTRSEAKT